MAMAGPGAGGGVAWDPMVAKALLKSRFGHADFRGAQRDAIAAVVSGRDVLYVAATGSGKSLCFQFPTLYLQRARGGRRSCTIVISPLLALMDDQVAALTALDIKAMALNSSTEAAKRAAAARCEYDLIYTTPETAMVSMPLLTELSARGEVDCIAIDEAHCVTEWGMDFRPEFRQLHRLREVSHTGGGTSLLPPDAHLRPTTTTSHLPPPPHTAVRLCLACPSWR
jgi:ATP-dependent DNA helicase RecQ